MRRSLGRTDALPGVVASIQTLGSFGNWHPHIHAVVTDGLVERGGGFLPLWIRYVPTRSATVRERARRDAMGLGAHMIRSVAKLVAYGRYVTWRRGTVADAP